MKFPEKLKCVIFDMDGVIIDLKKFIKKHIMRLLIV